VQVVNMTDPGPPDRASTDSAAVDDARRRLREQGIVAIEPDERIGVMLGPDERLVAVRRAISMERRTEFRNPEMGLRGDLYVTTSRLVYLGLVPVEVPLADIREADVVTGALRLVVGNGRGLEIRTADPDLLRVEIAAVREAARAATAATAATAAAAAAAAGKAPSAGEAPSAAGAPGQSRP
jgi:hypothetical protein